MAQVATTRSEADILREVIIAHQRLMSPELARYVLELALPEPEIERLHALSAKNQRGALTDDERQEMERYLRIGHFLNLMKSQARRSLQTSTTG